MYKKEPPFGGPTIKRREPVQVQGITVKIFPPKAPPKPKGIERALVSRGNSKEIKIENAAIKTNVLLLSITSIIGFLKSLSNLPGLNFQLWFLD